ncbi:MAG: PEP-CTERM sorting domain-containing protein [Vicinamibacterales bacterium]
MLSRILSRIALVSFLGAVPQLALAGPITIDFDTLADGDLVISQFTGLTFSNATVLTAGISLNEFEFPPQSGNNVVFDDGGPMRVDFASPVVSVSGYFNYLAPVTLSAFDALDSPLGTVSSAFASNLALSGDLGSLPSEWLALSALDISYITLTADAFGGSFTLDNLTYDTPTVTVVPEPGTLSLVLLGGLGAMWRKRRNRLSAEADVHKSAGQ